MRFYLNFGFLRFKVANKRTINLFKGCEDFGFLNLLSDWIEKYKPALNKSVSSWDNSYCVRLVIVSLAVDIGKLQPLVSDDNFSSEEYNVFWSDFLLCDVKDFLRM